MPPQNATDEFAERNVIVDNQDIVCIPREHLALPLATGQAPATGSLV